MKASSRLDVWAFVISLLSAGFTGYSLWQSQRSYDRAAGKITANLSIVGINPDLEQLGPEFIDPKSHANNPIVRFATLNQLETANPRITVENTGDEPIDSVRVSVRFITGMIDSEGMPAELQRATNPKVLQQTNQEDYAITLAPGRKTVIPFIRELLGQMRQAQNTKHGNRMHFGAFLVRCSASLVGLEQYDLMENSLVIYRFGWLPSGFPEQETKDFLATFKPTIEPVMSTPAK